MYEKAMNIPRKLKDGKVVLEDFLPKETDFDYGINVYHLVKYIELQGKLLGFEKEDLENSYIYLNPASEKFDSFLQIDSLKFLIYLSREKVIKDLYLPIYAEWVEIPGKKIIITEQKPSLIWGNESVEGAIRGNLYNNTSLRNRVVRFIVVDWKKFSEIKNKLKGKEKKEESIKQEFKKQLDFDLDRSILYTNEYAVKIQKFSDQYHLLRIIFEESKELSREWFFSEIAEKYDEANDLPVKKFYNAVYQLNKKIAIESGIKGFFITNTQSFKIDNKYLKQS